MSGGEFCESALTPVFRGLEQTRAGAGPIAELAEQQYGVVGRRQLVNLGMGGNAIDRRLRSGYLYRLHPGVYAVGHRAIPLEGRWLAAVLCCGSTAVLSHRTAAALWGLRGRSGGAIEVTAPRKSRSRGGITRHRAILPADEMTTHAGIPVTTVPRTLFDLAAVGSVDVVENALRESEYLRLYDRLSLPDLLDRYPARRGTRVVKECLARRAESPSGRVRSRLEERFLPFLRRYRLPPPQLNAWIPLDPKSYEVDCLWPEGKQIVELDGYAGHGTRRAFREDRARDRRLRVAGYGVTRIAWGQLDNEPEEIAADLQALLAGKSLKYKRP